MSLPLIIGIVAVLVVVLVIIFIVSRRSQDVIDERLDRIDAIDDFSFLDEAPADDLERGSSSEAISVIDESRRLLDPINDALADRQFGKNMRQKLARANVKLTVAEYAASHLVSSALAFGIVLLLFGNPIVAIFSGFIGLFIPRIYVGRLVNKRLIEFERQLPDTLSLWVNALRSGYSVLQAMEAIANDSPEPTQTEFERVVREVQLGIDMQDALAHLVERIESEDLDLVVTAVNIQREVGGNLAEILDVISHTIRERIKLKGEIRVLTSQGRITGYLISFLPVALALFLNLTSPAYMGRLFEDRVCGWPMIGVGVALIGMGAAAIQRIIDIEI